MGGPFVSEEEEWMGGGIKGRHIGNLNDISRLAPLVWFILAHLTSRQTDHIETAYELHIENSLEVVQGVDQPFFQLCTLMAAEIPAQSTATSTSPDFLCWSQSCLYILLRVHLGWGKQTPLLTSWLGPHPQVGPSTTVAACLSSLQL